MSETDDSLRLLIVEDEDSDLQACRSSADVYRDQKGRGVRLVESTTLDDALQKVASENYDGAIVDLTLADRKDGGEQVIDQIAKLCLRIPVAIMTGTPRQGISPSLSQVKTFIKGEAQYVTILDWLYQVSKTGLTRIFGRNGQIEDALNAVYSNNLWPQLSIWLGYAQSTAPDAQKQTEKALLRLALDHVTEKLEDDNEACYPEEVYIFPPSRLGPRTGSIVQKRHGPYHVVLNPACDLVMRECTQKTGDTEEKDYSCKTDMILLAEIDQEQWYDSVRLKKCKTEKDQRDYLEWSLSEKKKPLHVHWLPRTLFFSGGFINFRKLSSVSNEDFQKEYETPRFQISPPFIKDVQARFSSYYGRQGQPEIACDKIFGDIILSSSKEHEDQ